MKEIKLNNELIAIVDEEDFERVNKHVWTVKANNGDSILRVQTTIMGKEKISIFLNRFILNVNSNAKVFHIDNNELNFQKKNLIIVDQAIITRKRRGVRNSSSKYKGVSWNKKINKWVAQINVSNKVIVLGYFSSEDKAAEVYNRNAFKYFGEYGYQNIIGEDNSAKTFNVESKKQRRKTNKLGYKGITMKKEKYEARVWNGTKFIYAGISSNPVEAAKMHDKKAYELFGNKSVLNFPEDF